MVIAETAAENQCLPSELNSPYLVEWAEDDYGLYQILKLFAVEHVFRWIPPGTFQMGSPPTEKGRYDDESLHWVNLSQGFWLGETVVTQQQWMAAQLREKKPSHFQGLDLPVDSVSYHDCQQFLNLLNQQHPQLGARLPTEAEWEYACRAGTETPFYWGGEIDLTQANYFGSWDYENDQTFAERALQKTCVVKSYSANPWGLFQMHGNVWEWCHDWFEKAYPEGELSDPQGPPQPEDNGSLRVLRGGSWLLRGRDLRSAFRGSLRAAERYPDSGFRLALGCELQYGRAVNKP